MTRARIARVLATMAALLLLSALTRVPWRTPQGRSGDARLRLSWRVRGEIIQRCRRATDAELANVPAHMRQEVICEGARVASYRVRVAIDGRAVADRAVAGSDAAGEGTLYFLDEFGVAPGDHRVAVSLVRADSGAASPDAPAARGARDDHRHAVPRRLMLDTTLTFAPRQVSLVTYSAEAERLVVIGP